MDANIPTNKRCDTYRYYFNTQAYYLHTGIIFTFRYTDCRYRSFADLLNILPFLTKSNFLPICV